jgi:hypothetical protein
MNICILLASVLQDASPSGLARRAGLGKQREGGAAANDATAAL